MQTVRLTTAQAIVRWMLAQKIEIDGVLKPVFAGVFGIFGHGNVVSLAEALQPVQDQLPTWRGHNEQSMALAGVAFAKAARRRQIMVATSSVGPGSTNMVTAAAVAHANRLPVLLISGDTFQHRLVDPVLQQVEHFNNPTITVSDTFKPVTRYWDRITRPEQIIQSLPQALGVMLDPADCGPAYLGLPQDVAAEAFDFPEEFFAETIHHIRRPGPDPRDIDPLRGRCARRRRPLIISGGGVHYSDAAETLTPSPLRMASRSSKRSPARRPSLARPSQLRRADRGDRQHLGQRARQRRRRGARRRYASPGLHHGFVVGVQGTRLPARVDQRGPLRRHEAPAHWR